MVNDVVILGTDCQWTWALANALRSRFDQVQIIIENREGPVIFWRRRIRSLGFVQVLGQVGFGIYAKCWRSLHRGREREIVINYAFDTSRSASDVIYVSSANDPSTIDLLLKLKPKVVVVSQTRILSSHLLTSVPAVFINVHTGITPYYRGHYGAYWALVNTDNDNCGVTIHIVDAGIDTGAVIAQARIRPSPVDNCFTYHWAQLSAALPLLINAIQSALSGQLTTLRPTSEKRFLPYSHPTIWAYLRTGISRGLW